MRTHLLQEFHQKEICIYCGNELSDVKWESEFHGHFHYKTTICPNCKTKKSIKIRFSGTGHDNWDGKLRMNQSGEKLEDKIEKTE